MQPMDSAERQGARASRSWRASARAGRRRPLPREAAARRSDWPVRWLSSVAWWLLRNSGVCPGRIKTIRGVARISWSAIAIGCCCCRRVCGEWMSGPLAWLVIDAVELLDLTRRRYRRRRTRSSARSFRRGCSLEHRRRHVGDRRRVGRPLRYLRGRASGSGCRRAAKARSRGFHARDRTRRYRPARPSVRTRHRGRR
jgi:hypothetical protein